jgi:hypothetical protein
MTDTSIILAILQLPKHNSIMLYNDCNDEVYLTTFNAIHIYDVMRFDLIDNCILKGVLILKCTESETF